MNSNVITKTTENKKKRVSTKLLQTSKALEETISQELSRDTENVKEETPNFSKVSIKENINIDSIKKIKENIDSIKKIIEKETAQDITVTNLQTSTPKKEIIKPKIIKKTAKKGELAENEKPKMKKSENKPEDVKPKKDVQRKERQKISKKNMEVKQGESK